MYGLKQAARLAHDKLVLKLGESGYHPDPVTPNIWTHELRKTRFCLCVDDFGIKYHSKEDAEHLIQSLQKHYDVTIDYAGKDFCGLNPIGIMTKVMWIYA